MALKEETKVSNELSEIDLNLPVPTTTDPATKVVTYQCLCKVKGKVRFALVNSDETGTLDEIVVESPTYVDGEDVTHFAYTDVTLVTLRAQVFDGGPASVRYAVVVLENVSDADIDDDLSALQVYWQQAWGGSEAQPDDYPLSAGLANAGQARVTTTTPVKNTYNWAVNALGIKAASKFQLPLLDTIEGGDAEGMGWRSPEALAAQSDLQDGDIYQDASMVATLGRAAGSWTTFIQPERVAYQPGDVDWQGGTEKNLFYNDGANHTVNLITDLDVVPPGSIARVFNMNPFGGSPYTLSIEVDSSSFLTIANSQMAEFLFWVDDNVDPPVGRWIAVQRSVFCSYKPTI